MNLIDSIVVDDEKNGRENLIGLLNRHCPEIDIIAEASSSEEAISKIEEKKPHLVFLDIEMPGENGFGVLNHFDEPNFKVIFVTAYDQFAIQAIRFSALDYLLKPIDAKELRVAIDRFHIQKDKADHRLDVFKNNKNVSFEERRIAIPSSDKIDFIKIKDIVSCKGEGGYTRISLSDGPEVFTSKPLIFYEELLEGFNFLRTHKAYLINTSHVVSYVKSDGGFIEMSNQQIVPVSRRRRDQVLSYLFRKS